MPCSGLRSRTAALVRVWRARLRCPLPAQQPGTALGVDAAERIPAEDVDLGGLREAFQINGDHFLAIKISYWLALR